MKMLLGEEYAVFEASLEEAPSRALRINRLKAGANVPLSALPFLKGAVPYAADSYFFEEAHIGSHPLHHAGAIYVQEPAAMAPVSAVPVERGWAVLDLCASPGGKSGQLAALIGEEGTLIANEYNATRCVTLAGNIERLGIRNAVVTNADAAQIAEWYPAAFDLVVVDAPCSGEGMFRKNELAAAQWTPGGVENCADVQRSVLREAAMTVKPGGWLLYSTCTFEIAENEAQVAAFLSERSDFRLVSPASEVVAMSRSGVTNAAGRAADQQPSAGRPTAFALSEAQAALCRRFYPHSAGGERQFLAVMRRSGDDEADDAAFLAAVLPCGDRLPTVSDRGTAGCSNKGKKCVRRGSFYGNRDTDALRPLTAEEARLCHVFLSETLTEEGVRKITPRLSVWNGSVWAVGAKLPLPAERVYLPGVCVGTLLMGGAGKSAGKLYSGNEMKGRFQPHHQLFSAYGQYFRRQINLCTGNEQDDRLLSAYLHGDVIPADFDGWGVVTVWGCPLGGVKASGGVGKNHYPKGLRRF